MRADLQKRKKTFKMLKWIWITFVVVLFDQITKYIASTSLHLYESISVLPIFNWTLRHNTGAAFSFLANEGGWQRWFFAVIAVVVSVVIVFWIKRLEQHEKLQAIALALILGGAIGNVIDRIWLGYVVDFIHVFYRPWSFDFPAFNIADSAISIGVALIIIDSIREYRAENKAQKNK